MYETLLDEIGAFRRTRGKDLQPPASDAEIDDLKKRTRQELRYTLPDAYAAFLRRANGFEFNGLSLYATGRLLIVGTTDRYVQGLVEANLEWRQAGGYRDEIVFGHSGGATYVFHTKDGAWQVRSQPTDSVLETVGSLEELLLRALEDVRPRKP